MILFIWNAQLIKFVFWFTIKQQKQKLFHLYFIYCEIEVNRPSFGIVLVSGIVLGIVLYFELY